MAKWSEKFEAKLKMADFDKGQALWRGCLHIILIYCLDGDRQTFRNLGRLKAIGKSVL